MHARTIQNIEKAEKLLLEYGSTIHFGSASQAEQFCVLISNSK